MTNWLLPSCLLVALIGFSAANIFFAVSCEETPEEWSIWSRCSWPHGDLRELIRTFLKDAKDAGCQVPPEKLIKRGMKMLTNSKSYLDHPLYKRAPTTECGYCARKTQCCKRARSFLTQSFQSRVCSDESPPCEMDPLTDAEVETLREWYPDVALTDDRCDIKAYLSEELKNLRTGPAYLYVEPLLCQVLGTKIPTINCQSDGGKCKCCCFGYRYEDGACVVDEAAVSNC